MEKLVNFVKSHPVVTAVVAVLVLVVIFWPRGTAVSSGGTTDSTAAAAAVSASQQATAQMQLSSDQVRAIGIQAASAEAMNASDNAAAVAVATLSAQTEQGKTAAAAQAATQQATLAETVAKWSALSGIAQTITAVIPTTQKQSLAAGQQTDAAGFSLMEMFRNILTGATGQEATATLISQTNGKSVTSATIGSDGKLIEGNYLTSGTRNVKLRNWGPGDV